MENNYLLSGTDKNSVDQTKDTKLSPGEILFSIGTGILASSTCLNFFQKQKNGKTYNMEKIEKVINVVGAAINALKGFLNDINR